MLWAAQVGAVRLLPLLAAVRSTRLGHIFYYFIWYQHAGFLMLITKKPNDLDRLRAKLSSLSHFHSLVFHAGTVDMTPPAVRIVE